MGTGMNICNIRANLPSGYQKTGLQEIPQDAKFSTPKHKQSEEEWGRRDQEQLPILSGPEIAEDLLNPREWPWLYSAKEDKEKP